MGGEWKVFLIFCGIILVVEFIGLFITAFECRIQEQKEQRLKTIREFKKERKQLKKEMDKKWGK